MSAWSCDPATPSVGSAAPDRFSGETVHPSLLEAGHRRPLRHRVAETGPLTPTGGASAPAVTGTGRPRCCDPSPTPTPHAGEPSSVWDVRCPRLCPPTGAAGARRLCRAAGWETTPRTRTGIPPPCGAAWGEASSPTLSFYSPLSWRGVFFWEGSFPTSLLRTHDQSRPSLSGPSVSSFKDTWSLPDLSSVTFWSLLPAPGSTSKRHGHVSV